MKISEKDILEMTHISPQTETWRDIYLKYIYYTLLTIICLKIHTSLGRWHVCIMTWGFTAHTCLLYIWR